ncbi:MAG: hypothetical protein AAF609_23275 [Cyanobacteria bacterium P01_C01_bin.120]
MAKRKSSAPKYTPERASAILAEAELFGDGQTCEKWRITRQTLHNYRVRLTQDDELLQLFTLKKRILVADWQSDATKCLKIGLSRLTQLIPQATSEDADTIHAIVGAVKIVGELKITSEALLEDGVVSDREGSAT